MVKLISIRVEFRATVFGILIPWNLRQRLINHQLRNSREMTQYRVRCGLLVSSLRCVCFQTSIVACKLFQIILKQFRHLDVTSQHDDVVCLRLYYLISSLPMNSFFNVRYFSIDRIFSSWYLLWSLLASRSIWFRTRTICRCFSKENCWMPSSLSWQETKLKYLYSFSYMSNILLVVWTLSFASIL